MEEELYEALQQHILNVEREYNERMAYIESIDEARNALHFVESTRNYKIKHGLDAKDICDFVQECKWVFDEMVDKCLTDPSFKFDFAKWAQEIRTDLRVDDFSHFSAASVGHEPGAKWDASVATHRDPREGVKTVRTFLNILQANGRLEDAKTTPEEQKSFFWASSIAWSFAVVGMLIALGFLTMDFYLAQTNLALHIDRIETPTMPYPAITVCADGPRAPIFLDFPTKDYPGISLFRLADISWRNSTKGKVEHVQYPNTIPGRGNGFEEIASGPDPDACKNMRQQTSIQTDQQTLFTLGDIFNVTKIQQAEQKASRHVSNLCYWCVRIGAKSKMHTQIGHFRGSGPSAPPYQLTFHRSKILEGCTTLIGIRHRETRGILLNQLRIHAQALMDRGTLDFGDFPPGNPRFEALLAIQEGFDFDPLGIGDFVTAMGFACNVYFYSGYFYPTEGAPDIRYRFVFENKTWVQTGKGPYYTTRVWDKRAPDIIGPGNAGVESDRYTTNHLQILFQDPDSDISPTFVPIRAKIANIEANSGIFLSVKRREEREKIGYLVDSQSLGSIMPNSPEVSEFAVGIGYSSKHTLSVDSVATMAWSSYLTDVFEFVGLFTGVCIFTLFVAPAHTLVKG